MSITPLPRLNSLGALVCTRFALGHRTISSTARSLWSLCTHPPHSLTFTHPLPPHSFLSSISASPSSFTPFATRILGHIPSPTRCPRPPSPAHHLLRTRSPHSLPRHSASARATQALARGQRRVPAPAPHTAHPLPFERVCATPIPRLVSRFLVNVNTNSSVIGRFNLVRAPALAVN
jgi:hypothetical protein